MSSETAGSVAASGEGWFWRRFAGMRGNRAERVTRWLGILVSVQANLFGTAIAVALGIWVLSPPDVTGRPVLVNAIAVAVYVPLALAIGIRWATKQIRPARAWLRDDRPPTAAEQASALRVPLVVFWVHAWLWFAAALGFGTLNGTTYSNELGVRVGVMVALAGLGTAAFAYLLTERVLRPIAARALSESVPERPSVPGVKSRALLAWALAAGLPTAGLVAIGISARFAHDFSRNELAIVVISLGTLAVVLGFFASLLAARAVADPIASVRQALARVERGELDVQVPVYDGSDVGLLQSGFNRMVAGLRERERLHDLFGRHVGEEVARAALESGGGMQGEVREIAVLFVDVVGSTELAHDRSPEEVVEILNRFFAIVVETVDSQGGWINKFEGDAALAIFGAPAPLDDFRGRALAAGRELSARLAGELTEVSAGIGISAGEAVAGNVGAERRYEYTVIGDPVNEAARLSELAKTAPGMILASLRTVESAAADEAARWAPGDEVELRGRGAPTRLAHSRPRA